MIKYVSSADGGVQYGYIVSTSSKSELQLEKSLHWVNTKVSRIQFFVAFS